MLVRECEEALSGLPHLSGLDSQWQERCDAYMERIRRLARIAFLLWYDLARVGQTMSLV